MSTAKKVGAAGAGALMLAVAFIKPWEGLWTTAQVDTIGTGRPITYCYGQTDEFGKVRAGEKFTPQQCSDLLLKSLPKYANAVAVCVKVDLPDKVMASLISGAYNAGPGAICKSPMVAKMNAGNIRAGCEAFRSWYIRAQGRVVKGLINRRNGEAKLCLEGVNEPAFKQAPNPAKPAEPAKTKPPEPKVAEAPGFWAKLRSIFSKG